MALSDAVKAGATLFIGVVQFAVSVILAESVSPDYSVSTNYISDLGKVFPRSASIFNPSIILLGMLVLVSAYFIQRTFHWKPGTAMIAMAGIGQIGVGLFPEGSQFGLHSLFSLITFLSIGLAAIVTSRWQKVPLSYFSVVMGAITLVALLLYVPDNGTGWGSTLGIGAGGLERLIVYPVLFWSIAFSGHLMASDGRLE